MRYTVLVLLAATWACSDAEPIGPGDAVLCLTQPRRWIRVILAAPRTCNRPKYCGTCGNRCVLFGADVRRGRMCPGSCLEGYVDLNNDVADGCEYQCSITNPLDPIDEEGRDEL